MANPKRRHSNTRTRLRRAHDFLSPKPVSKCTHCGAAVLTHQICPACGYYRGRQVITVKVKEKKKKS
ncbi:MAG: 50S ribosomal protein L32 [Candidatus Omnitrophica bacterium]|nr:50S ribosomal protein L32 [Candidatus Omnitrophota bacterium]